MEGGCAVGSVAVVEGDCSRMVRGWGRETPMGGETW